MEELRERQSLTKLVNELLRCQELKDILQLGRKRFGNPLILSAISCAVVATSDEPKLTATRWLDIQRMKSIPVDALAFDEIDATYAESRRSGRAVLDQSSEDVPMLRKALMAAGKVVGYLDSPLYFGRPDEEEIEFFDMLGNLLAVRLQRSADITKVPDNMLDYFAFDLLEGRITDQELIAERLNHFKWNPLAKGFAQIIYIRWLDKGDRGDSQFRQLAQALIAQFPTCRVFVYGVELRMICPVSESIQKEGQMYWEISRLLEGKKLSAGVSRPWRKIDAIADFNRQARKAAELGAVIEPDKSIHFFDNLSIYYALELAGEQENIRQFQHSAILCLRDYDAEHDSDLLKSLQVYLTHNQSIGESAAALYIHRNTMNYRITKIRELTSLDFSSPDVCAHLLFSFYVQTMEEKGLGVPSQKEGADRYLRPDVVRV